MSSDNTLPFICGAVAGAVGLAAVAYLSSDERLKKSEEERNNKAAAKDKLLEKKLNQMFFVACGVSLKIQTIMSRIAAREIEDFKSSFKELYAQNQDKVENYFYYEDHIEEVKELHKMLVDSYRDSREYVEEANLLISKKGRKPVSFKDTDALIRNSKFKSSGDDFGVILKSCDQTLDLAENIMIRGDKLIELLNDDGSKT